MQEETYSDFHFKKRFKKPKLPLNLNIPDPVDFFKIEGLNRPPSVPILGRRLSSESILNNRDDSPILLTKLPFKKYRRKSIPDRLSRKSSVLHRKSESRCKQAHKQPESRPPLDKSSKILQIKSSKSLIKKPSLSIAQINKIKQKFSKISVNPNMCRKVESSTPSRITRKNSDGKEHEELKKNNIEHKGLIIKHEEAKLKSYHKSSKSALSVKLDGKKVKKIEEKCKKKAKEEKSNNAGKGKKEEKKEEKKLAKKIRKLSSDGKPKKNKGKDTKKDGKKILKKKTKEDKLKKEENIKLFKKKEENQWIDHSFDFNNRGKVADILEYDDRSYADKNYDNQISDLQASEIKLNLSIPSNEDRLSKISSIAGFSLPDSKCRPKTPVPLDSFEQNSIRIYKKPSKNTQKIRENSAVLIQKHFRGFLVRKVYEKIKISLKDLPKKSSFQDIIYSNSIINSQKSNENSFQSSPDQSNIDKSDYQAPKPSEIEIRSKVLSPLNEKIKKALELSSHLDTEKQVSEISEKDLKSENFFCLDSLKLRKASIEDLRKRDLEAIKKITFKTNSESEIFEIFQSIINRRYETINSMFDENIKAVQEALAQSILSEDSFKFAEPKKNKDFPLQTSETVSIPASRPKSREDVSVKSVDFDFNKAESYFEFESRFYKKIDKSAGDERARPKSPEANLTYHVFRSMPSSINHFITDQEPTPFKLKKPDPDHSGKIVWIDEVAMPGDLDLSDMLIESAISESLVTVLQDIIEELFTVPASLVLELSEELILGILLNEAHEKIQSMKKDFSEEAIIEIIQRIFIKTQDLILQEILKPLEKDPLIVLSEVQEAEIGCGFIPEEKYAMLNLEAFEDDIIHDNTQVKVFNKMVFDCINDSLERLIVKEDLPWATVRYKQTLVRSSEEVINYILNRLISFSEIRAGEIGFESKPEPEISLKRESEINRILCLEASEEEREWVRYDKEELQSKLDLADMVLEQEIDSIVEVLFKRE